MAPRHHERHITMAPRPQSVSLVLVLALTVSLSTMVHTLASCVPDDDTMARVIDKSFPLQRRQHLLEIQLIELDNGMNERDVRLNDLAMQQNRVNTRLNAMDGRLDGIETAILDMRDYVQKQMEAVGRKVKWALMDTEHHTQKDDLPDLPDVPQPLFHHDSLDHSATDADIRNVSLKLWQQDMDRMTDITVNRKGDGQRFFKHVDQRIQDIETYKTMRPLLRGTYNPDLTQEEKITIAMIEKEEAFLNTVNTAALTTTLYEFLHRKGMIQGTRADFFNKLQTLWFGKYRRKRSDPINSCGFEHVFVGEYRGTEMTGLHNWVQLYWEEQARNMKLYYRIAKPGFGYSVHITWTENGVTRTKDSSFLLGNSPEYQIAVFTLCLLYNRAQCKITNGVNNVNIVTHVHNLPKHGVIAVGSAYPRI